MGSLALLLVVVGVFIIYEVAKDSSNVQAASSSTSSGGGAPTTSSNAPSPAGVQNQAQWQSLLQAQGLPSNAVDTFMGIINRESTGLSNAICYAPGADASKCTPYPKPGDTQGAFGPFQFLNSTWNGYGCSPAAPTNPLGLNTAALDPIASVQCAAKAFKQNGFRDWGL